MKLLNRHARRCEPYSDGPWFFVYDVQHAQELVVLDAHDVLLGISAGVEAERRLERMESGGLVLACETAQDRLVVDVLVGTRLSPAQRNRAEWVDSQSGYLSLPSGRLRIESLNSLSIGPDQPDGEGCELEVEPGAYDVTVRRVVWELLDVESPEDRPELPTVVLEFAPVGKKGPKATGARLTLAAARGEVGEWMVGGTLEGDAFRGGTYPHTYDPSRMWVNLRRSHAEQMGLRFGDVLELRSRDSEVRLPFVGHLSTRGLRAYFGPAWYEEHLADVQAKAGFAPFEGSTPWLLEVEGVELPVRAPVALTRRGRWFMSIPSYGDGVRVEDGAVTGRIVWIAQGTLVLNFGLGELRRVGVSLEDVLLLEGPDFRRKIYLKAGPRSLTEERRERCVADEHGGDVPLLADSRDSWDGPDGQFLWAVPLVGDDHGLRGAPGDEVTLRPESG